MTVVVTFKPRPAADIAADIATALAPSANNRFIVRHAARDKPFHYLGDTAWELVHRLDLAEAELFLRNRAAKGFNSIMVVLVAEHGGVETPNRYGAFPFLSVNAPGATYEPDMTRPNPAYFDFVDHVVALASSLDMTIAIVPTWGRYMNGGYHGNRILFNNDTARSFGRFLGERYPFHPFVIGGDSNRHWVKEVVHGVSLADLEFMDWGDVFEAMAQGVHEGEAAAIAALSPELAAKAKGYESFMTYHSAQQWHPDGVPTTASNQFPDADWLTVDGVQSGHYDGPKPVPADAKPGAAMTTTPETLWYSKSSYLPIRQMYAARTKDGKPRPVLELEAHYEATHHWFDYDHELWTARDVRSGMWQGIFAGACGYTYGCNSIWQMRNALRPTHPDIQGPCLAYTNWFDELDLDGAFQAGVARRIMETMPGDYFARVPDQSFIVSDTHERADERAGDALVGGMKGEGWAAVHLPYGGKVEVNVGTALGRDVREWRSWWINPRTGGRNLGDDEDKGGEVVSFTAPSGGSLENDWILLVTAGVWPLPAA